MADTWLRRFRQQLQPLVEAEREPQRRQRPKRRGRPKPPVVTEYLNRQRASCRAEKEELGLDHYQVMSATGIVRFWTLVMAAYLFLDEERVRLRAEKQRHVTPGEARQEMQRLHRRRLIDWLSDRLQVRRSRDLLYDPLAGRAAAPSTASATFSASRPSARGTHKPRAYGSLRSVAWT